MEAEAIITSSSVIVSAETGVVRDVPDRDRVAIIGAGPSRAEAPWDDPSWSIWGLNEIAQPRAERWFELHPMAAQSPGELEWLARAEAPVYLLDLDPRVPRGVRYPLERVLALTGGRRYFTCTFAYQVALAVAEGASEIGLWGVDLDLGTPRERIVEKPCVEYWLGLAEGRGVRVVIPTGGTLLRRPHLYGYDYDAERADIERVTDDTLFEGTHRIGLDRQAFEERVAAWRARTPA